MRNLKARVFKCALAVAIAGLGLYSYPVRELLASLALFAVAFLFLGMVALGTFLVWHATGKLASGTGSASRNMVALSRRFRAGYTRS